jgi:endogenous inhibitor of DNA gyrase (YacG/DUF329 family)
VTDPRFVNVETTILSLCQTSSVKEHYNMCCARTKTVVLYVWLEGVSAS